MIEALLVGGSIGVVCALIASLSILLIHRRTLARLQVMQEAWQRAQEVQQQQWQFYQEKRLQELEQRVRTRTEQIQAAWQAWEEKDAERAETLKREYETATTRAHIEFELGRLPRVEDTPLTLDQHQSAITHWQPPRLQGADLSHRNLASRYLGYADLRGAQLAQATLFMADLFRAWMAKANLAEADLTAANLTEADLRGANLSGANLLVADLNNTVLIGADLRNVRNLTMEQLHNAIYDHTTKFDVSLAGALPHIPQARHLPLPSLTPVPTAGTLKGNSVTPAPLDALTEQGQELPVSEPLSVSDSKPDSEERTLQQDTAETAHAEESITSTPSQPYSSREQAGVD